MEVSDDLKARLFTYALLHADRVQMFKDMLNQLYTKADAHQDEKTVEPLEEFNTFVSGNVDRSVFLKNSLLQLNARYESLGQGNEVEDRAELIRLGSSVAILYCKLEDNELVREFVPFLFSMSENDGEPPAGMPEATVQTYLRVLSRFARNMIQRFVDEI